MIKIVNVIIGLTILLVDGILLYGIPGPMARFATPREGWIVLGGIVAYAGVHFLVRKPERMYLWGHEFSHLVAAKLFFRKIHQFHISSRTGGKVVMDGTNAVIDLAPYIFPFYGAVAAVPAFLFRRSSPWVPKAYLAVASFLFAMHVIFSVEGFLSGQPDVKRKGRIFSAGVFLFFLLAWIPLLMAPGVREGWKGALVLYREWFFAAAAASRRLVAQGLSFL